MLRRVPWIWTGWLLLSVSAGYALAPNTTSGGRDFYASPRGAPGGDGSRAAPWDLQTALTNTQKIKPGDTLWLLSGTYPGLFTSRLKGTSEKPILVKAMPGERATLCKTSADDNVGTLTVRGDHVSFRDLEITNSFPNRSRFNPGGKIDPWRGSAVNIFARGIGVINCVLHDAGHGVGLWNEEGGAEIYGCLMYYNGNSKKDHGVYGHNRTGVQRLSDNIICNGAGYGLHLYANSQRVALNGFEIEGNILFNNGALTKEDQAADQLLVGGVEGVPARRIMLRDNYVYVSDDLASNKNRGIRLGYEDQHNEDASLTGNYVAARLPLRVLWWKQVTAQNNTLRSSKMGAELATTGDYKPGAYQWQNNTYVSPDKRAPSFRLGEQKDLEFSRWKQTAGVDADSKIVSDALPAAEQLRVFVRPNRYEPGRAHVAVFNWNKAAEVTVNVTGVLAAGDPYVVLDAQNFYGEPVATGVYNGQPLRLPMRLNKVSVPVGQVESVPRHTAPEFAAFVILRRAAVPGK